MVAHATPASEDHRTGVVAHAVAVSAAEVRQPDSRVLFVSCHAALAAALLPVDPPERNVLIVEQVAEHNVLDGVGHGRVDQVHGHLQKGTVLEQESPPFLAVLLLSYLLGARVATDLFHQLWEHGVPAVDAARIVQVECHDQALCLEIPHGVCGVAKKVRVEGEAAPVVLRVPVC